jgi:hypothetical protein
MLRLPRTGVFASTRMLSCKKDDGRRGPERDEGRFLARNCHAATSAIRSRSGQGGHDADSSIWSRDVPSQPLLLGYPGQAHTMINALAFGEVGWVITENAVLVAADGKGWIKRKSRLGRGTRLIERAQ